MSAPPSPDGAGSGVRKPGRTPDAAGRRPVRRCPRHREPAECARRAERILSDAETRTALVLDLEQMIWRHAITVLGAKTLEEFVTIFEPAGCSSAGEAPAPSLERSVLLWHATIGDVSLATRAEFLLAQRCPVDEELFRAQQDALVLVGQNRGGIYLRDVFFDRPDVRLRDDWPVRFAAHARPEDRFLLRIALFRHAPLLEEIGISTVVLEDGEDMANVAELLRESAMTPSEPDWGWHITAMWLAAATEDWAREHRPAHAGSNTRQ